MQNEHGAIIKATSMASALQEQYVSSLQKFVGHDSFQNISRLTENFSIDLSSFLCYEIQLWNDLPSPDFLFCVHKPDLFKKAIDTFSEYDLNSVFDHETYTGLRQLERLWNDDVNGVKRKINNIWFEFDHKDLSTQQPKPNFFFGPKTNGNMLDIALVTQKIIKALFNKDISGSSLQLLLHCFTELHGKGIITQIGMMNARNDEHLRVFFQKIPRYGILPFLERVGYKHARNKSLLDMLGVCEAHTSHTDLDLDLLDEPGENIGLECYFDTTEEVLSFLDILAGYKISTPQNHENIRAYLKGIHYDKAKSFQPFFSHFKIVFNPYKGFISKAYLGFASNKDADQIVKTKPFNSANHA